MSYPVSLNEDDFEIFRMIRNLGKQNVLRLLEAIEKRQASIDDLIDYVNSARPREHALNEEALSFIFSVVKQNFPQIEIPAKFSAYLPTIEAIKEEGTQIPTIKARKRARKGEVTPQSEYRKPILETLIEIGGRGSVKDILKRVFEKMKDRLTPKDLEKYPASGGVRWPNYVQWERQNLVTEGYLKKDSPRGVWEITEEGRRFYESMKGK